MRGIHGAADEMAVETGQYVWVALFDIGITVTGFAVRYCSVCRNGAGLPANLIPSNTTGKVSFSV